MNWNQRITQAREAKEMDKSTLAELVGVSPSSITQWENGTTKKLEGSNLIKACAALGVSPDWLLTGEKPQPAPIPQTRKESELQWITGDESEYLSLFRAADEEGRRLLLVMARSLKKSR